MKATLPLAILLASCGQQSPSAAANEAITRHPGPTKQAAAPAAKAFVLDEKNDLIEFHYGWSAEAAAIPQLVDRLRKEMEKRKTDLVARAEEDKSFRDKEGFDFNGYMSSTDYKTAGQSARLLSLLVEVGSYTGGAHGNFGVGALIWDHAASKEIDARDLFVEPSNMNRLLTQRWCDALNKAREEKRGEPIRGGGMFDDCPKLSEIAIVPADMNGNRRFERLMLVASPYVAGPWVEGSYEIELAVTPDLIAALKSDYRGSFEAGQPQ